MGVEETEPGVEASNAMRGSNIPTPLPEPADRPMISTSADEFDYQKSVGHSITPILQFRFSEPWATWGCVPREKKDQMWLRFKQSYQWDPRIDEGIRKRFVKHASSRWNGMSNVARTRAIRLYEKNSKVPFDDDYSRLTQYNPTWMKQDCWLPLLRDVWNKDDWKAKSKQNKKNRNTSVGGHHTCGSRSFNSTRKYLEIKHKRPISSTEFFTHTHAMKGTKPLDQQPIVRRSGGSNGSAGANGSAGTNGSVGVNGPAGENGLVENGSAENGSAGANGSVGANGLVGSEASTSTGVGESNEVGESSGGQAVEPRWVNEKSREHIEKYQEGMLESHGENVESHPHDAELWNKVTTPNRGNTFGAYNASDPVFLLTGMPSTCNASASHPAVEKVEVLEKSMKDLEQAREKDKELFEEAIEQERKLNGEKLDAFKEEMKKDTNDKLAEALAQLKEQPPTPQSA